MNEVEGALLVDGGKGWGRQAAGMLVDAGIDQIRTVHTFRQALDKLTPATALILTEVQIGREKCFTFLREVHTRAYHPLIIATCTQAPLEDIFLLHEYGVHRFIEQPLSKARLHTVVTVAHQDSKQRFIDQPWSHTAPTRQLSAAEHAILRCLRDGMTYRQIATTRGVSLNTVKTQVRAVLGKLGVADQRSLWRSLVH